jgi:predicted AAA+ superfamily ATPase
MAYQKRVVDDELALRLSSTGGVVIEGPKACGKTATARQFAASEVLLDIDANARQAVAVDPALVLAGDTPRLIDEWQIEPVIWNHIRRTIDDRGKSGQFILTGSAVPADDLTRHTGAARLTRLRMRPMSLYESGQSTGTVSLRGLLDGDIPRSPDPGLNVGDIVERIAVGGWPGHDHLSTRQALQWVRDYLDEIRRVDVGRVDATRRDPEKVGRLLRSLARNVATSVAVTTLGADAGGADGAIKDDTIHDYLEALERLMIVENQPAWAPHLRSRSILRTAAKRHFVDPSLAVAALRATPERLLNDMNLLGLLFESMVIRDLRIYAQATDASVYHYRDNTGLEADAIVETTNGQWGAFEIKLGAGRVEQAAANLLKFVDRIDTAKCGKPTFLTVITGMGYGYARPDGVSVVPIGALAP